LNTIAALRGGDRFVFEQVFIEYHKKLYFYILSKTRSSYLAEETVQLSFIKLWRFKESLDEDISISRQIFRIARTSLIDILRKEESHQRMMMEMTKNQPVTHGNPVEEWFDQAELTERIFKGVKQMPPVRRKIFKMSRLKGMSYKEIASELSLSVKTVENHISRAIKQLQEILTILLALLLLQ
jgi:RNA polymerase sigma-70 factor (family 1)